MAVERKAEKTLIDGRVVSSAGVEWMEECAARHAALLAPEAQHEHFEVVARFRGTDARKRLQNAVHGMLSCMRDEAERIADMPTQEARREGLAAIRARGSDVHAQHVEALARKIFAARLQ